MLVEEGLVEDGMSCLGPRLASGNKLVILEASVSSDSRIAGRRR